MRKYEVEFLDEVSGCWFSVTGDYVDAESREEAVEFTLDWKRDYIASHSADSEERDRELAEMEEITYRVREHRKWDEDQDLWILRSKLGGDRA